MVWSLERSGAQSITDTLNEREVRELVDLTVAGPLRPELWPIANTFRRGHRVRLQVSSGAHPVYARNLGTGEPPGLATTMRAADLEVFRSPLRPSAVQLPAVVFPDSALRPEGRA